MAEGLFSKELTQSGKGFLLMNETGNAGISSNGYSILDKIGCVFLFIHVSGSKQTTSRTWNRLNCASTMLRVS